MRTIDIHAHLMPQCFWNAVAGYFDFNGDIILTGAPGAVEQLSPGDVVEIEIPGIGTLRNPVAAES